MFSTLDRDDPGKYISWKKDHRRNQHYPAEKSQNPSTNLHYHCQSDKRTSTGETPGLTAIILPPKGEL